MADRSVAKASNQYKSQDWDLVSLYDDDKQAAIAAAKDNNAEFKGLNEQQIEEKLQANGKLLQDFIIFFDKRITSIEEHMQGLHYNYTSCCHHLVQMEIAVAQLSSKIREHIVPQQDRLEL